MDTRSNAEFWKAFEECELDWKVDVSALRMQLESVPALDAEAVLERIGAYFQRTHIGLWRCEPTLFDTEYALQATYDMFLGPAEQAAVREAGIL